MKSYISRKFPQETRTTRPIRERSTVLTGSGMERILHEESAGTEPLIESREHHRGVRLVDACRARTERREPEQMAIQVGLAVPADSFGDGGNLHVGIDQQADGGAQAQETQVLVNRAVVLPLEGRSHDTNRRPDAARNLRQATWLPEVGFEVQIDAARQRLHRVRLRGKLAQLRGQLRPELCIQRLHSNVIVWSNAHAFKRSPSSAAPWLRA